MYKEKYHSQKTTDKGTEAKIELTGLKTKKKKKKSTNIYEYHITYFTSGAVHRPKSVIRARYHLNQLNDNRKYEMCVACLKGKRNRKQP